MEFVTAVYEATKKFPSNEMYGLTNQMRRAAVSIPSNIAEGQGRLSPREFHHYLGIARGSLMEVETQLRIALNLKYLSAGEAEALLSRSNELGRILNGLMTSIQEPSRV